MYIDQHRIDSIGNQRNLGSRPKDVAIPTTTGENIEIMRNNLSRGSILSSKLKL